MEKTQKRQSAVAAALCMATTLINACAPEVISEATMVLPAQPVAQVQLYEPGDSVPDEAIGIGQVAVRDGGMSSRCKYDQVVQLAKQRTAETGGNGLLITEHKKPNFWGSSCHQIAGTMLYIPTDGAISDSLRRVATELATTQRGKAETILWKNAKTPANVLGLSMGVSFIGSTIYTPWKDYKNKTGMEFLAHYDHYWKKGYGIGLAVDYYTSSIEGYNISTFFIGPEVGFSARIAEHWRFDIAYGLGYGNFTNVGETQSGLGMLGRLGLDYMFSDKIGLGFLINAQTTRMKKPADFELKDNEFYGVQHLGFMLGLHFYL